MSRPPPIGAIPPYIYGIRTSSGHSIRWLTFYEIMCPLRPADTDHLLAMCHGTYWTHIPSILQQGLRAKGSSPPGARARYVLYAPPTATHVNARGRDITSGTRLSSSTPGGTLGRTPYYDDGDRRDDNILLAQAGSLNVRGPVDINYIYKIAVCDRGVPFFQSLEQAILYQPDMELPGSDAPVAAQISQSSYFAITPRNPRVFSRCTIIGSENAPSQVGLVDLMTPFGWPPAAKAKLPSCDRTDTVGLPLRALLWHHCGQRGLVMYGLRSRLLLRHR